MTRVYFIRHAEAEGNLYRRIHGWYDSLITDNGYRQIAALRERFRNIPIDAVYASDLFRTRTTARAIYEPRNLPLYTDVGLREVHMGWWEDRPWAEVARLDEKSLAQFNATSPDWKVPGGESLEEVRRRVGSTIQKLATRHDGQTIAVFSHGTAIRNTLAWFDGLSVAESADRPHSDNTAVSLLELEGDAARIVFMDDNSHLSPEISLFSRQQWWRSSPEEATREKRESNLWFRPLDFSAESELYYQARREAWTAVHHTLERFDGDGFLRDARNQSRREPASVVCAMQEDRAVGILQIDPAQNSELGAGHIAFYYIVPELRSKGYGVQLLGQAVSTFRPLGRDRLRLCCAPENTVAQSFYQKYGFHKVGSQPGGLGTLDILEKYVGYEPQAIPEYASPEI